MNQAPILSVDSLGVVLNGHTILRGITFSVSPGQTIAFIGPNGSGKTVLFRSLLGLTEHSGTVQWSDDIHIGYIPQTLAVDRSFPLTVREFFACKRVPLQTTVSLLETVGMGGDHGSNEHRQRHLRDHVTRQPIGTLSGGQFQRMMIAWALADRPDVLLFDEPTSSIDIGGQESVYALLEHIKQERGLTLLLISHDLDVVSQYADTVLCVNIDLICHGAPRSTLDSATLKKLYGERIAFPVHTNIHVH